jgi:hypothetical protein
VALVDSRVELYANDGAGALQAAEEPAVPGFVASAVTLHSYT